MSPRAAWRLEQLGFNEVYDYVAGKADWLAAGLPTEGPGSATPRPGGLARRRIATCRPDETVAVARARVRSSEWNRCVVLNDEHVVLGLLHEDALTRADQITAEAAMRIGPTTIRAHEDIPALLRRMHARQVASIVVTDPDGRLLGVLLRQDADRTLPNQTA
jgi:CBS domain-containing protein